MIPSLRVWIQPLLTPGKKNGKKFVLLENNGMSAVGRKIQMLILSLTVQIYAADIRRKNNKKANTSSAVGRTIEWWFQVSGFEYNCCWLWEQKWQKIVLLENSGMSTVGRTIQMMMLSLTVQIHAADIRRKNNKMANSSSAVGRTIECWFHVWGFEYNHCWLREQKMAKNCTFGRQQHLHSLVKVLSC